MRDRELELIAALVEGRLEDETEARALIESSAEHREEYEAQKLAYETLTNAGTISLSEAERSSLHREVWTALRRRPAPSSYRGGWYLRLAAVAAALFVVVGLAAVLGQGGDDQAEFTEIAADLADESAESDESAAGDDGDDSAEGDGAATFEDSSGPTTTATASETAPATETLSPDYLSEQADRVRAGELSDQLRANDAASEEELVDCVARSGLDEDEYVAVAILTPPLEMTGDVEVHLIAAVSEETESSDAGVAFVDLGACQVVYVDD